MKKRTKLRKRLLLQDPNRKKFWRLVKGQITAIGKITALTSKDGEMVFKQEEIKSIMMSHFTGVFGGLQGAGDENSQDSHVNDDEGRRPWESEKMFEPSQFESEVCAPFTYTDLENILKDLPSDKATGYDRF